MDFAPYQSSPPEQSRASLTLERKRPFSPFGARTSLGASSSTPPPPPPQSHSHSNPYATKHAARNSPSPPASYDPWGVHTHNAGGRGGYQQGGYGDGGDDGDDDIETGLVGAGGDTYPAFGGGGGGGGGGNGGGSGRATVDSFATSLPLRLDYEAMLAYLLLPPAGGVLLLILEQKSDYVRFHAWQSSLVFTALAILHFIVSFSAFLSWTLLLGDLALIGWLTRRAYLDADTLDRAEVPFFGPLASSILDDE